MLLRVIQLFLSLGLLLFKFSQALLIFLFRAVQAVHAPADLFFARRNFHLPCGKGGLSAGKLLFGRLHIAPDCCCGGVPAGRGDGLYHLRAGIHRLGQQCAKAERLPFLIQKGRVQPCAQRTQALDFSGRYIGDARGKGNGLHCAEQLLHLRLGRRVRLRKGGKPLRSRVQLLPGPVQFAAPRLQFIPAHADLFPGIVQLCLCFADFFLKVAQSLLIIRLSLVKLPLCIPDRFFGLGQPLLHLQPGIVQLRLRVVQFLLRFGANLLQPQRRADSLNMLQRLLQQVHAPVIGVGIGSVLPRGLIG